MNPTINLDICSDGEREADGAARGADPKHPEPRASNGPRSNDHKRLEPEAWRARQDAHTARLNAVVRPHLERRSLGRKHPVVDFLFEYYRFRPSHLLAWSPGGDVCLLEGAATFGGRRHFSTYGEHAVVQPLPPDKRASTGWILALLEQTQGRTPFFGCHGLHEWAMVYKAPTVRHVQVPLRLSPESVAATVERGPVVCTHFDAFRFFTPEARPLNRQQLAAGSVHAMEQPGCLHANMDLYRWAMKRYPWVPGELVADAFLLALEIREVDMRASPYDLSAWGYEPIAIETGEGRADYRRLQQGFHDRAKPLRSKLIDAYRVMLGGQV